MILEILGGLAAAAALVVGIMWAKQDHTDTTQRDSAIGSLHTEISNLETEAEKVRSWLRTPTTDESRVRDEKKAELNSIQERLAEARGKLKAMEGNAQGVPVAVSRKAFERAKTAGVLGMAAIIFGSAAGVLGVFTGEQ
ncbi:hypothetical protein [Pseudarthrobacter sp. NamB4]|uniref:hypothetical protein n=1 Tax=Pseudarthrobacter sp. NamB4 TaxID=2576837 RepID=UPI0010FD086A|nr:hypothetical protein [Pseudarthrobacter sp. NamB4]TLM73132.1 hypothetical protein FDW81_10675 [Pseudarthrobacter sp. NamB4]